MSYANMKAVLTEALAAVGREDDPAIAAAVRKIFATWTAHREGIPTDEVFGNFDDAEDTDHGDIPIPMFRRDPTDDLPTISDTPAPEPVPTLPGPPPVAHRPGTAEGAAKMSRVRAAIRGNDPRELVEALADCGLSGLLIDGSPPRAFLGPRPLLPALPPGGFSIGSHSPAGDLFLSLEPPKLIEDLREPEPAGEALKAELEAIRELSENAGPRKALAVLLTEGFSDTATEAARIAVQEGTAHDSLLHEWVRTHNDHEIAEWILGTATEGIVSFAFTAWLGIVDDRPVLERLRAFLGDDGLGFFRELRAQHGETWPTAPTGEGRGARSVHFAEGMQIRNWLRAQPEFLKLRTDDRWLDDHWGEVVNATLDGHDNFAIADVADDDTPEPRTPSGFVGWQCDRCGHTMRDNHRACPRCGFTVFSPLRNLPDQLAKSPAAPPAESSATAESDAERRAKGEAGTRTAPQPPETIVIDDPEDPARDSPEHRAAAKHWFESTVAEPKDASGYLIFDTEDGTYHAGDGEWTPNRDDAFIYTTEANAREGIVDVDSDAHYNLADRLSVIPRRR